MWTSAFVCVGTFCHFVGKHNLPWKQPDESTGPIVEQNGIWLNELSPGSPGWFAVGVGGRTNEVCCRSCVSTAISRQLPLLPANSSDWHSCRLTCLIAELKAHVNLVLLLPLTE